MKKKTNDEVVLELRGQVNAKKKLLKDTEKFSPKTNCSLQLDGERFNLNVIEKPTILLLLGKLQGLKTSLYTILPDESLEIGGFSVDLWIGDLKNKFSTLNRKLEEERLKKLEEKLYNLLSLDTKVELEIENIKNQI